MDAIGFVFATAFLATAFTIFGIIGRIVDGVADGLRYTVAPALIGGFAAWGDRRAATSAKVVSPAGVPPDDDAGDAEVDSLVVPVQGLGHGDPG